MTAGRRGGRTAVALVTAVLSCTQEGGEVDTDAAVRLVHPVLEDLDPDDMREALVASSALLAVVLRVDHGDEAYEVLQRAGQMFA